MEISRRKFFQLTAIAGGSAACAVAGPALARSPKEVDPDSLGMLNDSTRCIGCKACQVACKKVNKMPQEASLGEEALVGRTIYDSPRSLSEYTYTLIKLHRDDKSGEATFIKRQCMHCFDPACASACIVGALKKQKNGAVKYDADMCMGCRYCMVACPYNVPQFEWQKAIPSIRKCTLCDDTRLSKGEPTACTTACPAGAIVFGKRSELLKIAQNRIDSAPEVYNGHIYGVDEVGGTSVLYLSKKQVAFASLGLPDFDYRPVSGLTESIQHRIFQYFIPPVAVYGILGGIMAYNQRRKAQSGQETGEDNEY
jgi:Fe-S-cluster-containing dehydrogenase component